MRNFTLAQRSIAILMGLLLSWLPGAPLFAEASGPGGNLPVCCRKNGAHHCVMEIALERQLDREAGVHFSAPADKCPYFPDSIPSATAQGHYPALPQGAAFDAMVSNHRSCFVRAVVERSTALDRTGWKRGPPLLLPLASA